MMNRDIPPRLIVIGAAILLLTPCALVTVAGLLPEDADGEQVAFGTLPILILLQALFLYWYYRRNMRS